MKKPNIKISPRYPGGQIHIVEIDGFFKYECVSKKKAEVIEDMLDVLIESHKKIEAGIYEGRLPMDDFDGLNSRIKQALEKAGCEL